MVGPAASPPQGFELSLLDVGDEDYGESILLEVGGRRILLDGGHQGDREPKGGYEGIRLQLERLTGSQPATVDLLVVTHGHADHIGCLPELVANDQLRAEWALVPDPDRSWGRPIGAPPAPPQDAPVAGALAAMREEVPSRETLADGPGLAAWVDGTRTLQDRYTEMLNRLTDAGTRVVRHGHHDDAALLQAFAPLGMRILGPSDDQLALTADEMGRALGGMSDRLQDVRADLTAAGDPIVDAVELYRRVNAGVVDAADASRPGDLVNLQSIVTVFDLGRRVIFSGDMELAEPNARDARIKTAVAKLRASIRGLAPFAYAQLGHHGSANATSADVLEDLGRPRLVGMSAGRASDRHPSTEVMTAIAATGARWVRTDRNGLIAIRPRGRGWQVKPSRGAVDDPTPAGADARTPGRPMAIPQTSSAATLTTGAPAVPAAVVGAREPEPGLTDTRVEVIVRTDRRVTVTIDPDPLPGRAAVAPAHDEVPGITIGGGRALPPLLYVTDPAALGKNIGVAEAENVMRALRAAPGRVVESDVSTGPEGVRRRLADALREAGEARIAGIVLVGGYDVVAPDAVDCLPDRVAKAINRDDDADDFIVWSDDVHAQVAGQTALPISRVPDGHSGALVATAMQVGATTARSSSGVRNILRPFADDVYAMLPGRGQMLTSEPAGTQQVRGTLTGDIVYLMLHGYWRDGTRMWGESPGPEYPEAVDLGCVDARPGRVVLSGACWGALIADTPANRSQPGGVLGSRTPGESIALRYLAGGARAFIGCTGAHYSPPRDPPFLSAGAKLHTGTLAYLPAGHSPAAALAQTKRDYAAAMPHDDGGAGSLAIEYKLLWEFTCLGLGW